MDTLTIDCGTCVMRDTDACGGCVVTALCDRPTGTAVVIDASEARAVRMLGTAGLVPPLLHVPAGACA